jgi:tRNA (cmo5U34)-methyltransferase
MLDNKTQETNHTPLEKMTDFFTVRLDSYEEHMLSNGDEGYRKFAELLPMNTKKLLDLGCGTGLELDWIFKRLPDISVTGIGLTRPMLDKLKQKHPDKRMKLICGDYFKIEFGENTFDTVVSFQTMHHFQRREKTGLYRKIFKALNEHSLYIENDYMVNEKQRDKLRAESKRIRREQHIPDGEFYHFDIPYTVADQVDMLKKAGFYRVDITNRHENGAILIARKSK